MKSFEELKISTQIILKELVKRFPDSVEFKKGVIMDVAKELGYTGKDFDPLVQAEHRVKIGTYNFASYIEPLR